jgi:hypothetical protein
MKLHSIALAAILAALPLLALVPSAAPAPTQDGPTAPEFEPTWLSNIDEATALAAKANRPLMVVFR